MNEETISVAFFGDSLTEGYGLSPSQALPAVIESFFNSEGIKANCLNFGVSGETASDGLRRIKEVLEIKPTCVIIEFGANDCFVGDPVDQVRSSLSTMIEIFQSMSIPIMLIGISATLNEDESYQNAFNPLFFELAKQFNVPLYPDILIPYYNNNELTLMDRLHPNAQGVQAIAHAIYPQVRQLGHSSEH